MSKLITLLLAGLLVLGILCLNYTKAFGVEHHYEYAAEHGVPAPSGTIYFAGVGLTALGAGALGFRMGRRRAA